MLYPRARVLSLVIIPFLFTVIELPALVMLGDLVHRAGDLRRGRAHNPTGAGSGVAYFAHVGGFVFGLTTIKLFATNRKPTPPTRATV